MIRNIETLADEHEPIEAEEHHRVQERRAGRLSICLRETGYGRKVKKLKPRFQFDSIAPAVGRDRAESPMRVLLCNARTKSFLAPRKRWTKNSKLARDFRNGWWATVHAFTMDPRYLVIHYEFDDDRYNLHIPVLGHLQT